MLIAAIPTNDMTSTEGSDDDVAQIESISVSPDPPEAGKDLTITVKAANSEIIEVSIFFVPIGHHGIDMRY